MTQATSFPEVKPKMIIDIGYDHLAPSMAVVLSIHALHLRKHVRSQKHGWQFEKDISIEKLVRTKFFKDVYYYNPDFAIC